MSPMSLLANPVACPKTPRLSASDHVAHTLKKAIVDGVLPAGELLRQDEIAAHFQVSKIPVREALKHLEAKGLVAFQRNRGAVVASLSRGEIVEYMDIRAVLEARAAYLAAPLVSDGVLAEAAAHLDTFDREDKPARWSEANWLFHATLYGAAGRPVLLAEIRTLYQKVERYLRTRLARQNELLRARREHAEILAAFAKRDRDAAAELTRAHLLAAANSFIISLNDHLNQGGTTR